VEILRSIFWFEKGELTDISSKFVARKFTYETRWEADVMLPLAMLVPCAFYSAWWLGVLSLWAIKEAIRALNKKRFFDPT
jgi:hypothetical protein